MTFIQRAALPNSKKIILVELDITTVNDFWTNLAPFTWFVDFEVGYGDLADFLIEGLESVDIQNVGSVVSDGEALTFVSTIDACVAQANTYHYDPDDRRIYVHMSGDDDPDWHSIEVGKIYGISNFRVPGQTGYGEFERIYEPRLQSAPNVSKNRDPLFFGKISFDSAQIVINNEDGNFDSWGEDNNIFGNVGRVYIGFDDMSYSEYRRIYTGMIGKVVVGDELQVEMIDRRRQLSRKIPNTRLTVGDYPYIKYTNLGNPKPLCWGRCRDVDAIILNETETSPSEYTCMVADTTLRSISTVTSAYAGNTEIDIESRDLSAGTFVVSAGNDISDGITADVQGYVNTAGTLIENGLEITRLMLTDYFDIDYTSDFFNLAEWGVAELLARDVGIYVDARREAIDLIEEISSTLQGFFIVQDDGLYTYRIYDATKPSKETIKREEYFERTPKVEYDPTEVLTSIVVGYNRSWSGGSFSEFRDDSLEETNFILYSTYLEQRFETLLPDSTDTQDFADTQMTISGAVMKIVTLTTKMQHVRLEIGDFVDVEIERVGISMIGSFKAEVIGVNKNLDSMEMQLRLRLIEQLPDTMYQQADVYRGLRAHYGGDAVYGVTGNVEV